MMQMMSGFIQESPNSNPNPNPIPNNPTSTTTTTTTQVGAVVKRKRNLPGTPDPDAEVIALSPKSLMATNRFVCEICNKGFQRDQNLQLHRRGHNLPWKLKQRTNKEIKKRVYICPEKTCVHHDRSRALGDLTGIKKHFSRKHGEKKWKCEKCSKKYAVQSDWKAHSKTCGTREYKCDCGTLFSRKDSFITHRAFCDALAEESARITSIPSSNLNFRTNSINNVDATGGNLERANTLPSLGFDNRPGSQDLSRSIPQWPVYKPDFHGVGGGDMNSSEQQKPRLSLWLDQPANSQLNQIDISSSTNSNAFLASNPTGLPELVQMASTNHIFGSSSMLDYGGGSNNNIQSQWAVEKSSLSNSSPRGLKEESSTGGSNIKEHMVESLASFYSNNQQNNPSSAHMSATALLQKAASMGATRSNPSFHTTGFGVMSSSSSTTPSDINDHQFHQLFRQAKQQSESNLNNLMMNSRSMATPSSTSSPTTNKGGRLNFGSLSNTNNLERFMMMPSTTTTTATTTNGSNVNNKQSGGGQSTSSSVAVKLHLNGNEVIDQHSLTRDFLGVGAGGGGDDHHHHHHHQHSLLQQEYLEKFSSFGSAMDFSHI